jgi:membrane-associated phospholipid phosphatase
MKQTLPQPLSKGIFGTGWKNALVSLGLAAGVYLVNEIYAILNHGPAVLFLRTPFDVVLPVVPVFVVPYVSLEPVIYVTLAVFLLFRTRLFHSVCLAAISILLVSYGFYIFLQTEVIRPVLTSRDLCTQMIRGVYASDNPFNDFPSLHTSISTLVAIYWFRLDRRLGIAAAFWAALVVASTVLIKQHYIPDIFSGLALAFGMAWVYQRLLP